MENIMRVILVNELIPVLQIAIGPVILVSGVALLLLTMTNRLGRVIDRARILGRELKVMPPGEQKPLHAQLLILSKRATLIRQAIMFAAFSILFAAILVILLFVTALFRMEDAWLIGLLFMACMICLMGAMIAFIRDVDQSLAAMRLELEADRKALRG
ncbi:MAG: DUF2721 domain-containing protein [Methylobacter sp.]|nr:DUF2721 domain-containing protein [Methylobacter sp.]